jgi:hypothetical protein
MEQKATVEQNAYFADTVKVNFSNNKPIRRDKEEQSPTDKQSKKAFHQHRQNKISNILKANNAVDLASESPRNPFLESDTNGKMVTMSGINLKNTLTSAKQQSQEDNRRRQNKNH